MGKKAKDTSKNPSAPKQVVYLWGAGATQAEISYSGATGVNLLMQDIDDLGEGVASRIVQQLDPRWQAVFGTDQGIDIEKLISLLAASGVGEHEALAVKMRQLYFEDICTTLAKTKVVSEPTLAIGLLELHQIDDLKARETLAGIITTNHDGLLQVAAQKVYGSANLGMPFVSEELIAAKNNLPPILQLHGSFTWAFGLPVKVAPLAEDYTYSEDTIWIPPAIPKESKSYPFNKLAGLAYELLSKRCDVLRIVGSALTQNDWNVLSMLFNSQRHREVLGESAFSNPRMSLKSVRAEKGRLQGEDLLSERIEGFERGGGQGGGGSCAHSCRDHEGFLELPLPPPLNVESGAVRPR